MQVHLLAAFALSSVLCTRDICRENQTGDCDDHIEQVNIAHSHHLRFCTPLRRKPPVDPTCLHGIIITQFLFSTSKEDERAVNCTPFVRQYDIPNNKWGVFMQY